MFIFSVDHGFWFWIDLSSSALTVGAFWRYLAWFHLRLDWTVHDTPYTTGFLYVVATMSSFRMEWHTAGHFWCFSTCLPLSCCMNTYVAVCYTSGSTRPNEEMRATWGISSSVDALSWQPTSGW